MTLCKWLTSLFKQNFTIVNGEIAISFIETKHWTSQNLKAETPKQTKFVGEISGVTL